jgi:hypothetical protein
MVPDRRLRGPVGPPFTAAAELALQDLALGCGGLVNTASSDWAAARRWLGAGVGRRASGGWSASRLSQRLTSRDPRPQGVLADGTPRSTQTRRKDGEVSHEKQRNKTKKKNKIRSACCMACPAWIQTHISMAGGSKCVHEARASFSGGVQRSGAARVGEKRRVW